MSRSCDDELMLMAEIARLYYIEGIPQVDIAKSLYLSKARVSRALKTAREKKIVEFTINYPLERSVMLEESLKRMYGLEDARVALDMKSYHTAEVSLKQIGGLGAAYLDEVLVDGDRIGVSWGRTISQVVAHLKPTHPRQIQVYQVVGSPNDDYDTGNQISALAQGIASAFKGSCSLLYAPMYINNDIVRKELKREPTIRRMLERIRTCDYVLTGIADMNAAMVGNTWAGYLTDERRREIRAKGAVGYICGYFIDRDGRKLDDELNEKIVGIQFDELKRTPHVIAVAGGIDKTQSIHAALAGGLIDCLITDSVIAEKLLQMNRSV
ncbi:sugar-binding transcriptional regulator [Thermophilibacter sp.]